MSMVFILVYALISLHLLVWVFDWASQKFPTRLNKSHITTLDSIDRRPTLTFFEELVSKVKVMNWVSRCSNGSKPLSLKLSEDICFLLHCRKANSKLPCCIIKNEWCDQNYLEASRASFQSQVQSHAGISIETPTNTLSPKSLIQSHHPFKHGEKAKHLKENCEHSVKRSVIALQRWTF